MITATRRLQFCAGHRVHKHESKCANMHGHNYVLYFTAVVKDKEHEVDDLGRVIDFSEMKKRMNDWIEKHWDHGFIYYEDDPWMRTIFERDEVEKGPGADFKSYRLTMNPTAENMAFYLLHYVCPVLFKDTNVQIIKIVLHETENCSVEVSL